MIESCSVISDSLHPHGLYSPWNSPGKNTRVGNLSLLQQIFPTQASCTGLPHNRPIPNQLSQREAQLVCSCSVGGNMKAYNNFGKIYFGNLVKS